MIVIGYLSTKENRLVATTSELTKEQLALAVEKFNLASKPTKEYIKSLVDTAKPQDFLCLRDVAKAAKEIGVRDVILYSEFQNDWVVADLEKNNSAYPFRRDITL